MTKKRDLKRRIRERSQKTGESYAAARRQVLAARGGDGLPPDDRCPSCGSKLSTRTVTELAEVEYDELTDGQLADYLAAEESGDWGEWAVETEEQYCRMCEEKTGQFATARKRAKNTIQTKWEIVAGTRTMGWGGPIEAIEDRYPFIRASTAELGDTISRQLPILIFQSRESPPKAMEVAVPYKDPTGNPYKTRIVSSAPVPEEHVLLLAEFAQAIWFALDQKMLPSPRDGRALEEALAEWTGKGLLRL